MDYISQETGQCVSTVTSIAGAVQDQGRQETVKIDSSLAPWQIPAGIT
jgi:hypothetical protein